MKKLTAEFCEYLLKDLQRQSITGCGIGRTQECYLQALEIALPILEQHGSVKKLRFREGIEAIRKSTAQSGGYDFNALREHQEMGEWIECSQRMPPDNESVLTWDGNFRKIYCTLLGQWQCWQPKLITHWQPLPSPPEEA